MCLNSLFKNKENKLQQQQRKENTEEETGSWHQMLACLLGQEKKERENVCFSKILFRKEKKTQKKRERFQKNYMNI
jgi:hypothetical protein